MNNPVPAPEDPPAFNKVAIIGVGLIGGSMARLIRRQAPQTQVYGLDNDTVLEAALADGVITHRLAGLTDPALYACGLILLGTHLHQSYEILKVLDAQAQEPIRVMDLGSAKAPVCRLAETLSDNLAFIGGHPLAGREVSGYQNGRWDLFYQKRFLLTPCGKTPEAFKTGVSNWLAELGILPVVLEAGYHDELMALVSHFPQFYAVALASLLEQNNPQEALQYLGGGIDDQMRLMASPYEMWRDVFGDNKQALDRILAAFIQILERMKEALAQDDLKPWFDTSHRVYGEYQAHRSRFVREAQAENPEANLKAR